MSALDDDAFEFVENGGTSEPPKYILIGTWLCEDVGSCTCGAGVGFYAHEPHCGLENIVDLKTLPGWEAMIREAGSR